LSSQTKPTLAVIGAGLAGLTAAWLMRHKYHVTLFERHSQAGMGVYTTDYESNGVRTRIDVPLRIFTPGYYPSLFALYEHLGIEMESSDHSAAFQTLSRDQSIKPFFQYKNSQHFHQSYLCWNSLNVQGLKLLWAQRQFFRQIREDMQQDASAWSLISFGDYLEMSEFSTVFIERMLLPALAVTLTCDYDSVKRYPADMVLEYLTCGVRENGIVRAKQGVDGIVPKLTQGYAVRCGEQVEKVISETGHGKDSVRVTSKNITTQASSTETFDRVILACQADVASTLLSQSEPLSSAKQQGDLLAAIPLERSTMVLHTDSNLVFDGKRCSPVSYLYSHTECRAATTVDLTQAFSTYKKQAPVYQTWHPIIQPDPESILCQASFTRPLVNLETRDVVQQLQALNQNGAIKICGSYMTNKFPLLDAAVESSIEVARLMGAQIPWEKAASSHDPHDSHVNKAAVL